MSKLRKTGHFPLISMFTDDTGQTSPLQTIQFDIPGKFNWSDVSDLTERLLKLYGQGTEDLKRLSIVGRPDIALYLESLFSVDSVKAVFDA